MRWNPSKLGIAVVPVVLLGATTFKHGTVSDSNDSVQTMARATSCPHEFRQRVGATTLTQVPLAGAITAIPLYHDCQRLLMTRPLTLRTKAGVTLRRYLRPASFNVDKGAQYFFGPLVGLYVSARLSDFENDAVTPTPAPPIGPLALDSILGVAPGTTPDFPEPDPTPPTPAPTPTGVAVIQFYNHTGGVYRPLGIGPNFTCLYLLNKPYEAWSVNIDTRSVCRTPLSREDLIRLYAADRARLDLGIGPNYPRVTPLMVNTMMPSSNEADFANVGRFDWDFVRREHYVTIRCGKLVWCEIGSGPPISSPTYWAGVPPHIWRIKGWHDEQRMTLVNVGPTVSSFRGTLLPVDNLGSLKIADFEERWVHVADALITETSSAYKTKLNFDLTPLGEPERNRIYYRKTSGQEEWRAMIVSAKGDTVYKRVHRRPAPRGIAVPATARWRWIADDETVWTKCDEGCCEIIG